MNGLKIGVLTAVLGAIAVPANAKNVDLKKSSFQWKATKKVGSSHTGKIFLKKADVKMNGSKIAKAEFVMDMNSFTVEDLDGKWKDKFMSHVKSGDFFEVTKHPTAKLTLTKVEGKTAEGTLTIKGKPAPVKVAFNKSGNTYSGKLTFDRTKHGITYGSSNFFKKLVADKVINDTVDLDFKVVTSK